MVPYCACLAAVLRFICCLALPFLRESWRSSAPCPPSISVPLPLTPPASSSMQCRTLQATLVHNMEQYRSRLVALTTRRRYRARPTVGPSSCLWDLAVLAPLGLGCPVPLPGERCRHCVPGAQHRELTSSIGIPIHRLPVSLITVLIYRRTVALSTSQAVQLTAPPPRQYYPIEPYGAMLHRQHIPTFTVQTTMPYRWQTARHTHEAPVRLLPLSRSTAQAWRPDLYLLHVTQRSASTIEETPVDNFP